MPSGTFPVIIAVELRTLWITQVATIVVTAMHEIHSAHERNLVVRLCLAADNENLLMMAPATTNAIVEEDLTSRGVHSAGEHEVFLLRIRSAMRSPNQPANAHTSLRQISEHHRSLGAGTRKSLVGVTFEVGQENRVACSRRA